MSFYRMTAVWSGPGGPGTSHFDFVDIDVLGTPNFNACLTAYRTYFNSLAGYLPNEWSIGVSSEIQHLSDAGVLEELAPVSVVPASVTGTYTGSWAGAVGVCTRLVTAEILNGRRLRGKSFFVPAGTTVAFDQDGTMNSTALGDFLTHRTTLHNAVLAQEAEPVVWSPTHSIKSAVTGFNIADRSAVLRTRRD